MVQTSIQFSKTNPTYQSNLPKICKSNVPISLLLHGNMTIWQFTINTIWQHGNMGRRQCSAHQYIYLQGYETQDSIKGMQHQVYGDKNM